MTTYPGGKSGAGVYQAIINQLPPHQIYVEGFLGMGAILRHKRPALLANIAIDIDPAVIAAWDIHPTRLAVSNIPALQFILTDFLAWLDSNPNIANNPAALIYLDPPYLMETRSSKRPIYNCEFGDPGQHQALLDRITTLKCMVAISGYYSDLYFKRLYGWRSVQFQTITRGGSLATEWLWMNYGHPMELHDYRYLGSNFRERERIKRKQVRWKTRLETMPAQERFALLAAIDELRNPSP